MAFFLEGEVFNAESLCLGSLLGCRHVYSLKEHLLADSLWYSPNEGYIVEAGVYRGSSIRLIAKLVPERQVIGFDSFKGLPECWILSQNESYERGHFALRVPPRVPSNVQLVIGLFEETMPRWAAGHAHLGRVTFLHIDCDLYGSSRTALFALNEMIRAGTVIVFDELCDFATSGRYPLWPEHEWKALKEWMAAYRRETKVLARTNRWEAALQVVK